MYFLVPNKFKYNKIIFAKYDVVLFDKKIGFWIVTTKSCPFTGKLNQF